MRKIVLFLLLSATAWASIASNFSSSNAPGAYGVGFRVVQQYDRGRAYKPKTDLTTGLPAMGERARPVQTLIWYPIKKAGGKPLHYGDYLRSAATETAFARSDAEIDHDVASALEENYPNVNPGQVRTETGQTMLAVRDAAAAPGKFPVVYAPGSSLGVPHKG